MVDFKNPIVKGISALALALILLIGTGAGSVLVYKRWDAQQHKVEIARVQAQVAEATKAAAEHEQRANDFAAQRDAARAEAKTANDKAAVSRKKLEEELAKPKPSDLTEQLALAEEQRDTAVIALADEQDAHKKDNAAKVLVEVENKELRLEVVDLKAGLTRQIQLTTKLQEDLEKANRGRIRWRNITIGVSLVGGGAALGSWLARR